MRTEAGENSLGKLVREITERDVRPHSKYLLINKHGKRMTKGVLRLRWDTFRNAVMTVLPRQAVLLDQIIKPVFTQAIPCTRQARPNIPALCDCSCDPTYMHVR